MVRKNFTLLLLPGKSNIMWKFVIKELFFNASIIKNCHDQGALLTFFILTFILFQGELDYEIQPNDRIVFISTLHGGWCLQYWNNSLEKSRSWQFQICLESFCTEIKIFSPLGVLLSKQEVQKRNITFLYEWYCLTFFYTFDNNSKMSFIHACKIEWINDIILQHPSVLGIPQRIV